MRTMRAAVIPAIGAPPEVKDLPIPRPGPGEALVRVAASALQPVDVIVASGRFYDGDPAVPFVPGLEAIGTVVAGDTLSPGSRVRVEIVHPGYGRDGACAEYVVVPERPSTDVSRNQASVEVIDDAELTDELLAALGSSGATAWRLMEAALAAGATVSGGRVLVLGGTGVVGELLVQLARARGAARIVAIGRHQARLERMVERGADAFVALHGQELGELTEEMTAAAGGQADVVFDPLWGEPAAAAFDAIAAAGVLVNFGGSAGIRAPVASVPMRSRGARIIAYSGARSTCAERTAATRAIFAEARAGRVQLDHEVVGLEQFASAWARQIAGAGTKLVVVPASGPATPPQPGQTATRI